MKPKLARSKLSLDTIPLTRNRHGSDVVELFFGNNAKHPKNGGTKSLPRARDR